MLWRIRHWSRCDVITDCITHCLSLRNQSIWTDDDDSNWSGSNQGSLMKSAVARHQIIGWLIRCRLGFNPFQRDGADWAFPVAANTSSRALRCARMNGNPSGGGMELPLRMKILPVGFIGDPISKKLGMSFHWPASTNYVKQSPAPESDYQLGNHFLWKPHLANESDPLAPIRAEFISNPINESRIRFNESIHQPGIHFPHSIPIRLEDIIQFHPSQSNSTTSVGIESN